MSLYEHGSKRWRSALNRVRGKKVYQDERKRRQWEPCFYCHLPRTSLDPLDHVRSLENFGCGCATNLVPAHVECNSRKGIKSADEFKLYLEYIPQGMIEDLKKLLKYYTLPPQVLEAFETVEQALTKPTVKFIPPKPCECLEGTYATPREVYVPPERPESKADTNDGPEAFIFHDET